MSLVSVNKPHMCLYEIAPSLSHDNKGVKTFVDSLSTIVSSRYFQKEVVGLEIYADHERIQYCFAVPETTERILIPKIRSTFKGSSVDRLMDSDNVSAHFSEGDASFYRLALKEPAFLPLQLNEKAQMFEDLTNTLEHMEKGERVWIQILLSPIDDDWQEEYKKAYENWLLGDDRLTGNSVKGFVQGVVKGSLESFDNFMREKTGEETERKLRRPYIREVNTKLSQNGFHTQIRMAVKASNDRSHMLSRSITASFRSLSRDNDFSLHTIFRKKDALKRMSERKMAKFNRMILSSGEIANMFKMPDKSIDNPKLKRMTPEETRVDERITQEGMYIGQTIHKNSKPVNFSIAHLDDVARSRLFIASPGGGKSTLIEQFVLEAARLGHGCAVFDVADGRLYERIIAMMPEYKHKLVCVDYTDPLFPPALNLGALGGDAATRGLMFAEFFEVFFKTEDLARTQSFLMKAALSVFQDPEHTMLEFIEMVRNEEFRKKMIPKLRMTQPDLYLWWMREFPKISENKLREIVAPIVVRLDNFLYNTKLRNILCQKGGKLNPKQWMEEGKIVVFNLSNGSFTEPEQRILMSLHNYMFWNETLAREKYTRAGKEPKPFHLIYDEPQTYMGATPMFRRAISKARKYRVSCNFFIQEAEQIIRDMPELWKEILGMSPHLMVGPVSESTARHVKKEFDMTEEEILSIKKHQYCWLLRTFINKEAIPPIVVRTVKPRDEREKVNTSHAPLVKSRDRQIYNQLPAHELQKDISARSMGLSVNEYNKLLDSYTKETPEETPSETFDWSDSDESTEKKKK